MRRSEYSRTVRLTESQRKQLLDQLDGAAAGAGGGQSNKRRDRRFEFRQNDVAVIVEHPGGGVSRMLVCCRNLSAGGVSFFHGGFLHPKSACKMGLRKRDNTMQALAGHVVNCRHIEGSVHEVGVKFSQRISPDAFLDTSAFPAEEMSLDVPTLSGFALLIDDQAQGDALAEHLKATGLDLTVVRTVDEADAEMSNLDFDLVICNAGAAKSAAAKSQPAHQVQSLRNAGHGGPIVLLAQGEAQAEAKATLPEKLATDVHRLAAPHEPAALFELLSGLLTQPREARVAS